MGEIIPAIFFVLSSGLFFQKKFRENGLLIGLAGAIALVSSTFLLKDIAEKYLEPSVPKAVASADAAPTSAASCVRPADVRNADAGTVHILHGGGDFAGLSPADKTLALKPRTNARAFDRLAAAGRTHPSGADAYKLLTDLVRPLPVQGTIGVAVENHAPGGTLVAAFVHGEGDIRKQWVLVRADVPAGRSTYEIPVSAPYPGYGENIWILVAFQHEPTAEQVVSGTNSIVGRDLWASDRGFRQLSLAQLQQAQRCGFLIERRMFEDGVRPSVLPADAMSIAQKITFG